jgi:hypothetical protein
MNHTRQIRGYTVYIEPDGDDGFFSTVAELG